MRKFQPEGSKESDPFDGSEAIAWSVNRQDPCLALKWTGEPKQSVLKGMHNTVNGIHHLCALYIWHLNNSISINQPRWRNGVVVASDLMEWILYRKQNINTQSLIVCFVLFWSQMYKHICAWQLASTNIHWQWYIWWGSFLSSECASIGNYIFGGGVYFSGCASTSSEVQEATGPRTPIGFRVQERIILLDL